MEKDWSVDETINQIKHLLLEKDAEIERLRSLIELMARRHKKLKKIHSEYVIKTTTAALKEGE